MQGCQAGVDALGLDIRQLVHEGYGRFRWLEYLNGNALGSALPVGFG